MPLEVSEEIDNAGERPDEAAPSPTGPLARLFHAQIVRFGFVSVVAASVQIVLVALVSPLVPKSALFIGAVVAVGYLAGTFVHFVLSRRFVFRPTALHTGLEFLLVAAVAAVGLGINWAVVIPLNLWCNVPAWLANVLALFPTFFWNYFARRLLIYNRE